MVVADKLERASTIFEVISYNIKSWPLLLKKVQNPEMGEIQSLLQLVESAIAGCTKVSHVYHAN